LVINSHHQSKVTSFSGVGLEAPLSNHLYVALYKCSGRMTEQNEVYYEQWNVKQKSWDDVHVEGIIRKYDIGSIVPLLRKNYSSQSESSPDKWHKNVSFHHCLILMFKVLYRKIRYPMLEGCEHAALLRIITTAITIIALDSRQSCQSFLTFPVAFTRTGRRLYRWEYGCTHLTSSSCVCKIYVASGIQCL